MEPQVGSKRGACLFRLCRREGEFVALSVPARGGARARTLTGARRGRANSSPMSLHPVRWFDRDLCFYMRTTNHGCIRCLERGKGVVLALLFSYSQFLCPELSCLS